MNLKNADVQRDGPSEESQDMPEGSVDSDAVQVPLPDNIDGLFGEALSGPLDLTISEDSRGQGSDTDQIFDDGYTCHQAETSLPINAQDMSAFSKHIADD